VQRTDTQALTAEKFIEILKETYTKYYRDTDGLPVNTVDHWRKHQINLTSIIKNAGYTPAVADVDFSTLAPPLIHWLSNWTVFHDFKFTNCNLIANTFRRCELYHSRFLKTDSYHPIPDCIIISRDENDLDSFKAVMESSELDIQATVLIDEQHRKPVIGVVYAPSHGTFYTELIIRILLERGASVVRLYTENRNGYFGDWQAHPLLKHAEYLDGIVLPGGGNVITDKERYTDREKMESSLVEMSLANKIPLLGVCRGHQFVGHFFGAELRRANGHQDDQIFVLPEQDSKLFNFVKKKVNSQKSKSKDNLEVFEIGPVYSYRSTCAHTQGVFFKSKPDERVHVTAQSMDGLPESLQVNDHIITFQHHHEGQQRTSIGKGAMKMFVQMVTAHLQTKLQPTPGAMNESGKRESESPLSDSPAIKRAHVNTEEEIMSNFRMSQGN
jgi:gamma-glutamyl-gamma-aminobutyrate hydrolase PuuD